MRGIASVLRCPVCAFSVTSDGTPGLPGALSLGRMKCTKCFQVFWVKMAPTPQPRAQTKPIGEALIGVPIPVPSLSRDCVENAVRLLKGQFGETLHREAAMTELVRALDAMGVTESDLTAQVERLLEAAR